MPVGGHQQNFTPQPTMQPQQMQPQQQQQHLSSSQSPAIQQQPSQPHYGGPVQQPVRSTLDIDDPAQLLEDEDALKDLGADFNILEFADPEPEKGSSTSAGKDKIDFDPEFEEFFNDRDLDERRPNEQSASSQNPHPQQSQPPQIQAQPPSQQMMHSQPPPSQQQQMPMQQHQVVYQQQHQPVMHQPAQIQHQHHQQPQQHSQNFDAQHVSAPHQQSVVSQQPNQYITQRQPQYMNQHQGGQRMVTSMNQQYASNQTQMMRSQQIPMSQSQNQIQQQQVTYVPRQQIHTRYSNPGHDMHQQPQSHQVQSVQHQSQQVVSSPAQMVRGGMPQVQTQYTNQSNFMENQQHVQHQHHSPHHQHPPIQQQPPPQQQQGHSQFAQAHHNVMYSNHPQHSQQTQMNQPRRQYNPHQQQQQQQQIQPQPQQHPNYVYQQQQQQPMQQQHQQMQYQPQQQQQMPPMNSQMMKNDLMMHDKNPIVGDAITSIEFNMYEPGSGSANEAANFPSQSDFESAPNGAENQESSTIEQTLEQTNLVGIVNTTAPQELSASLQPVAAPSTPQADHIPVSSNQDLTISLAPPISAAGPADVEMMDRSLLAASDTAQATNSQPVGPPISGRTSTNSFDEIPNSNSNAPNTVERSGSRNSTTGTQSENQLLKQLLATCPAADGPNQAAAAQNVPTTSIHETTAHKATSCPNITPKASANPGVPTISFQLGSTGKAAPFPQVAPQPAQQPPAQQRPPQQQQQQQPQAQPQQVPVSQQQPPAPQQAQAQAQPQSQPQPQAAQPQQQQQQQPSTLQMSTTASRGPNVIGPGLQARPSITSTGPTPSSNYEIKTYNLGQQVQLSSNPLIRVQQVTMATPNSTPMSMQVRPSEPISEPKEEPASVEQEPTKKSVEISVAASQTNESSSSKTTAKMSAKQKRNDYMAKRRAELEREPTPPPREVKPKKRQRGPNKRTRAQVDSDEVKTNDSTSNTSEPSQAVNGTSFAQRVVQTVVGNNAQPPKKRQRRSQKMRMDGSDSLGNLIAAGLNRELPGFHVKEPEIRVNNNLVTLFACGNLNSKCSRLRGPYGKGELITDQQQQSMLRSNLVKGRRKIVGYYHEEFPKDLNEPSIEIINERLVPCLVERDCDSPGSIISGSSSEFENDDNAETMTNEVFIRENSHQQESAGHKNQATKLYTPELYGRRRPSSKTSSSAPATDPNESCSSHDINNNARPMTPSIPISIKLPTMVADSSELTLKEYENKENVQQHSETAASNIGPPGPDHQTRPESSVVFNSQMVVAASSSSSSELPKTVSDSSAKSLNMRLKDHGNISLTLTLTDEEADGVKRVLSKLPDLVDQSVGLMSETDAQQQPMETDDNKLVDDKSGLASSLRLVSGNVIASGRQSNDLLFDELNYVPMDSIDMQPTAAESTNCQQENEQKTGSSTSSELVDVKPEICCSCSAIILDQGIKKSVMFDLIPERIRSNMKPVDGLNRAHELAFCSVNCYSSIITAAVSSSKLEASTCDDKKVQPHLLLDQADPKGFDQTGGAKIGSSSCRAMNSGLARRKWGDIRYTRWTPSHFELNKSIQSPMNVDEPRESIIDASSSSNVGSNINLMPSSTSQSQIANLGGDSSVDSNESDNSTSYSQSTSGGCGGSITKLGAQALDDAFATTSTADMQHRFTMTSGNEVISPWPEGMDFVQVRPIKLCSSGSSKPQIKESESPVSVQEEQPKEASNNNNTKNNSSQCEWYEDRRKCVLCHECGDGDSDGPARLLNFFIDGWVHLNCALWSLDVYELANGALMNVELACKKAMTCSLCRRPGATLKCFKQRCPNYYHFLCALKEKCSFYEDKSVQCRQHSKSTVKEMTSFVVKRRVYVNRDEQRQVAEMIQGEQQNVMRIGSLVFLNIGQLLPHQLAAFHDQHNIFPVGYKVIRYYWSYRQYNKRCRYACTIEDSGDGRPTFRVLAQQFGHEDEQFEADSADKVWRPIIEKIVELRRQVPDTITTFPAYIKGTDLFGLNEPSIVRILESLPGVDTLTDYEFKFGRSPLLELPLAINPTGCARTEPKLRTHFKRPYTIHTANNVTKSRLQSSALQNSDTSSPYIKQFVHSKSSQYRKMKSEWRNNVVLARSRVQGLGLYAARDIEKHTMVIEYIGMLIRNEIAERYERIHEANVSI